MKYKVGDVCFENNLKSLIGKIINIYNLYEFGHSNASHVFIITKIVDEDIIEIAEAGPKGVKIYNTTTKFIDTLKVKRSKVPLILVREIAKKYEGKPYGFDSYFMLFLRLIGVGMDINAGPSKDICSELVARILFECSEGKINFENEYPNYTYDEISPEQVFESKFLDEING